MYNWTTTSERYECIYVTPFSHMWLECFCFQSIKFLLVLFINDCVMRELLKKVWRHHCVYDFKKILNYFKDILDFFGSWPAESRLNICKFLVSLKQFMTEWLSRTDDQMIGVNLLFTTDPLKTVTDVLLIDIILIVNSCALRFL